MTSSPRTSPTAIPAPGWQQLLVAVDDRSLGQVGQWPWPRDTMARLVDRLAARKPAVIGMDILFAEPDRTSPDLLAHRFAQADPVLAGRLRQLPSNDAVFAHALSRSPVVLGVVGADNSGSGGEGFAPARIVGTAPRLDAFPTGERSLPRSTTPPRAAACSMPTSTTA